MGDPEIPILFADDSLLLCVKPVGVDSQAGLPALLEAQTGGRAFCVHRLDKGVGGLMVYARTAAAASALSETIRSGAMHKTYLAVCEGAPEPPAGEMRDLLYHDAARNKSYVVKRQRRGVREAVLRYRLLDTRGGLSLVRVELKTGRTHQIRVQFAARCLPLRGDGTYGAAVRSGGIALWSHALTFPHPQSGEILRFAAPPPDAPPWNAFDTGELDDAEFQTGPLL